MGFGSRFESYKPGAGMVLVQVIFVMASLMAKSLFAGGTSPMVFLVYRQAMATLVMVPTALIAIGPKRIMELELKGFGLVFAASLVGCALNQTFFYTGLKMTSSSMASAMNNIIPAVTFVMATAVGFENVDLRSLRSMAKIFGTVVCVAGAVSMALFKGPKLLGAYLAVADEWFLGCLILLAGTCCQSLWLILQVPICKRYLDPLSLSAWMCILSTFQSAFLTYLLEPDLQAWKITSAFEILGLMYTGVFASGVTFWMQSWVISVKGPVFSALFSPVQTVIATISAFLLLHEQLHLGSLLGAMAVMAGLYIVLWGKAKDIEQKNTSNKSNISAQAQDNKAKDGIKEPLLLEPSDDVESQIN